MQTAQLHGRPRSQRAAVGDASHIVLAASMVLAATSVAAAQSMLVSVDDLAYAVKDPRLVILHIADTAARFEDGHIPGARLLRYGDVAVSGADHVGSELPPADIVKRVFEAAGVSDDSRVVVYAQSPVMAARAFFTLDVFGHRSVALLDGGLEAWRVAGQPIARGPAPAVQAGQFSPRLKPQHLADADFIRRQKPGQTIALLDVRPDDEFLGKTTMGGAHAPGHIEGARQLTWNSLVGADGRFLPRERLKQKLEDAGVTASRPAVAYCMVGMRASVVYFVARMLGYEARLYDGSIVDWSRRGLQTVHR